MSQVTSASPAIKPYYPFNVPIKMRVAKYNANGKPFPGSSHAVLIPHEFFLVDENDTNQVEAQAVNADMWKEDKFKEGGEVMVVFKGFTKGKYNIASIDNGWALQRPPIPSPAEVVAQHAEKGKALAVVALDLAVNLYKHRQTGANDTPAEWVMVEADKFLKWLKDNAE